MERFMNWEMSDCVPHRIDFLFLSLLFCDYGLVPSLHGL